MNYFNDILSGVRIFPIYTPKEIRIRMQGSAFKFHYIPNAGKDWGQEENGSTEDEIAGWHHRLDGHEFE